MTDAEYLAWLPDVGFLNARLLPGGRWAALMLLAYTTAVVVGRIGDMVGYSDRWCYGSPREALAALDAWDGAGEPKGWHRHPNSGRRVALHADERDVGGRIVRPGEMYVRG